MNTGTSHTALNQADVAGKISGYYGVPAGDARILRLLEVVYPDVRAAEARDPGSWQSAVLGVIARHDTLAKELGLGLSQTQRDIDTVRHANRTDANFVAALARLGWTGAQHYASVHGSTSDAGGDGGSRGSGERSLSAALSRDVPLSATGAIGFAKELGIGAGNAGYFVGVSPEMRHALRDAIRDGKAITDDQVKNPRDVSAILGAVKSGKLKPDDPRIPDSVKKIIKDMKEKGIDPEKADAKTIQKYLTDHPDALKKVKEQNDKDIDARAGMTSEQLGQREKHDRDVALAKEKKKPSLKSEPTAKHPRKTTSGLDV